MWKELLEDYDIHTPGDLDLENSIFIGDAGGRTARGGIAKDFSCSDRQSLPTVIIFRNVLTKSRNFADNVGITFHTPEEYFLNEEPREFTRLLDPSEYLPDFSAAEGRS